MIIKSLLFIIVLIFAYETINKLYKLQEEYFTNQLPIEIHSSNDSFISGNPGQQTELDPELKDITKTIAINCKAYPATVNRIMAYKAPLPEELDTTEYARFKPLEYNANRLYFYRRDILIPEGKRRNKDDENEIQAVKNKYALETDITKKEILQDELDLFKWRDSIGKLKDNKGEPRNMRDITTDYFPEEIGQSRIWREPHSHIPDYSKSLNYGYDAYGFDKNNEQDVIKTDKFRKLKNELCMPDFVRMQKCKVKAKNDSIDDSITDNIDSDTLLKQGTMTY